MIDYNFIAGLVIWIINIIFVFSFLPQIILNYKLKTATGIADYYILGSFLGQCSYIAYSFRASLPLVYKVMNPIYTAPLFLLIIQRFYYSDFYMRKKICRQYFFVVMIILLLFFISFLEYKLIINFLGWIPIGTGFLKKLPQIFKIYIKKNVHDFSCGFIFLNIFGYCFEMIAAIFLNLPFQVIANDLKNIFIFSIFLIQFFLYNPSLKKLCVINENKNESE
ncbi:hypothetical protein GF322_04865 [Candidatus Dependentiae bacterium]|nr:hypothetical protein [Candidatus Dependentiae bacterium]